MRGFRPLVRRVSYRRIHTKRTLQRAVWATEDHQGRPRCWLRRSRRRSAITTTCYQRTRHFDRSHRRHCRNQRNSLPAIRRSRAFIPAASGNELPWLPRDSPPFCRKLRAGFGCNTERQVPSLGLPSSEIVFLPFVLVGSLGNYARQHPLVRR